MHQLMASEAVVGAMPEGAGTAGLEVLCVGVGPVSRGGHWRRRILPIRNRRSMVLDRHAATKRTPGGERSTAGSRRSRR